MSCEIYYPPLLEQQIRTMALEVCRGLYGFRQDPIRSLEHERVVSRSLTYFANYFNNNCLRDFLSGYLKEDQQLPKGNLFLQSVSKDQDNLYAYIGRSKDSKGMFIDGSYGFILYWQPGKRTEPLLLAATSFSPGNWLNSYYSELFYPDVTAPVIIQLQAQHYNTNGGFKRKNLAEETLRRFRWEHALVSIDVQWAQSVGIPVIHILPGFKNRYAPKKEEQMKMRYDVTAGRCGFKLDGNGLYTLPIELNT